MKQFALSDMYGVEYSYIYTTYGRPNTQKFIFRGLGNSNKTLLGSSREAVVKEFKKVMGSLNGNGNVYFTKNSKFPRYKLKGTFYKKVNKLEDADAVVYDHHIDIVTDPFYFGATETYTIVKVDNKTILIANCLLNKVSSVYVDSNTDETILISAVKCVLEECIKSQKSCGNNNTLITSTDNIEILYRGPLIQVKDCDVDIISGVLEGKYTNIINDSDLEKLVAKHLPDVYDVLQSIIEMLEAKDESVNEVGWKSLMATNIIETPILAKVIVHMFSHHMSYAIHTSTGMRSFLNSINLDSRDVNWGHSINYGDISNCLKDNVVKGEEALQICNLLKRRLDKKVKKDTDWISDSFSTLGVSVKVLIDFNPEV